jgi:hypothetical protein
MSGKKKHKRGESLKHFCGVPGKPCEHPGGPGNNYYTICAPGWAALTYAQQYTAPGASTPDARPKSYEAHHLLCVSEVKKAVVKKAKDTDLESIVKETHWCINAKTNMLAMPMWGHTIMWYCNDFSNVSSDNEAGLFQALGDRLIRPPFKDWPQHNYGHSGAEPETSYNKEVEAEMAQVLEGVEEAKEEHENKAIDALQGKLNSLSKKMRAKLKSRGTRGFGGTHLAWQTGLQNPASSWYEPFSMAQKPTPMTFPASNTGDGMARKLTRLAEAFWKL